MWPLFFFVANELKEVANDIIFGNSLKGIINNNYYCVLTLICTNHGSYNLQKSMNYSSGLEKSLNLVKSLKSA